MNSNLFKLSPSDFKYLWEDCKHCFYQKVKFGVNLPSIGMPGVFSKMNGMLQEKIMGMSLNQINPALPVGKIEYKERFLTSVPIPKAKSCYIAGKFDILSTLADGTYALIDFKITDPSEDKIQKFTHQLHAYKFALENPAKDEPKKISKMGVVAISPQEIAFHKGHIYFRTKPQWFEIPEDMDNFFGFIGEVSNLLEGDLPQPTQNCAWCNYRTHFENNKNNAEDLPF
ncbi:hypothetical protein A2697_02765 [Candidatus Curtissbacteria bacterium RIFCSPHIGHO2_01_FULL_41_44]|uniref:PD-(D/E)XK endonuclease-like domain-containing protein n=1 Tax=Candidatus Curtissbacteria bacterium RIFCSPLOWO2_01_FULL_42_50 TaxID=1797730 RepID=A0A1F5H5E0_9BACT|nr:MAG: hypothetical protein A3C33_03195 [Candidatus Curtissbacteria bacterium RIFCSPHIGHO2_02_FULL_42_58]OGD93839.1 MAG: hypothetical protein A2697_02765 [Candidatus Curtissbacteria bacterium RIFCSPHIGHO2_01_FULL_41_44]OGD97487.1 MAG: hypothetical protein A3E71_01705 [Candidatus Curtissbacteria bacterium RIFCSPHIGHO2_12_FULL_42_33]OGD99264.1 MAG: hypothetical protein A3B54_04010 [Candidatus Curtissbacteria bacterium RIFCSPLOWO2_01_FULL_42_50]OGE03663.1 MAG: hypothetical protein A3G16_02040 [Ca